MKTKTHKRPGPKQDPAITKLSEELAITRSRAAAIKREGGGGANGEEIRQLRARKLTLEIARLEIELAKTKGELVSKQSMVETGRKIGATFSACLAAMESNLPGSLSGLDEMQVSQVLRAEFDSMTEIFLNRISKIQ